MGQIPHGPRLVLTTAAVPAVPSALPTALRPLRSAWTGWLSGILVFGALGAACVDVLPWSLALLPLALLAGFLAARSVDEWPRVGFPACVLGVGSIVVGSGLFRAGIGWAREWDALRHAGALTSAPGLQAVLGTALAILLGGSMLAILFLHGDAVWRNLSSVRLAVVTLSSIGILSVIGTMVVQRFGAGALPDPEKSFVEKFMKGQGAVPVNARFMVAPPTVVLSQEEARRADLTEKAFGPGKARQMRMGFEEMRFKGAKAEAIERHVEARREHLLRLFERLDTLGFTNVFRTWWFNSLLVLLSVQVVAVLSKRYPWGWPMTGWVMTHCGVLVVLLGCVLSDGLLKDGSAGLSPGEVTDRFSEYTRLDAQGKPAETELGYRVKMYGTDQSFYHELEIAFPAVRVGDQPLWTQEQLRAGRVLPVKDPEGNGSYEIRILESHERAYAWREMVRAPDARKGEGTPVLRVRFSMAGEADGAPAHDVDEGYLFPDGHYSGQPLLGHVLRYRRAATEEEARDLVAGKTAAGEGTYGLLRVLPPGFEEAVTLPATPGETVRRSAADGTAWTFTVDRYHAAFWVGRGDAPEDADAIPEKPALEVTVARGNESGRMLVYADSGLQAQWETMARAAGAHGGEPGHGTASRLASGPAADCRYRFDFVPARQAWIVEGPGIARTLVARGPGAPAAASEFSAPGATAAVGPPGLRVVLVDSIPDAIPEIRIQALAVETDDEYLESCLRALESGVEPTPTVAAARIEVREKDGQGERTRTTWLVAERPDVFDGESFVSTDGRLVLAMAETKSAMMFRSALEVQSVDGKPILEDGKPLRKVVRVNHPLDFGGYAFYQNNFEPAAGGRPAASVFRVKYDRGIPTIYSGFAILVLGVCTLLYVDPMLRRRRKSRATTGSPEVARA